MIARRSVLALIASLPLVTAGGSRGLAAPVPSRLRKVAATATRDVEITTWPAAGSRKGTIAFSPGFGSSPQFYPDFVRAWTASGYEVVAPLHVDSRAYPNRAAFSGSAVWAARIEDMRAVAGLIEGPYVAAGHSFGALNALTLGGAGAVVPEGISAPLADDRVQAVIAFSPPPPIPSLIPESGYALLARPALIQTGTRDTPPSTGPADPESWRGHLAAFARSPMTNNHYALILDGVDHYFGGLICDPAQRGPDQQASLRLATQASVAFLARYGTAGSPQDWRASPAFPLDVAARYYRR